MPLLCSYCNLPIKEAPIAAVHLGCASKVMELSTSTNSASLPCTGCKYLRGRHCVSGDSCIRKATDLFSRQA